MRPRISVLVMSTSALLLLASSCGAGSEQSAESTTTTTTELTADTATTTTTSTTVPAAPGLELLAPVNCAIGAVNKGLDGLSTQARSRGRTEPPRAFTEESWTKEDWAHTQRVLQPAVRDYGNALTAFREALTGFPRPPGALSTIDDPIGFLTAEAAAAHSAAEATSMEEFAARMESIVNHGVLHAKFGFDPEVGTDLASYCAAPS